MYTCLLSSFCLGKKPSKGSVQEMESVATKMERKERCLESTVSRFFKVMLGSDFNEALFLPPKFAQKVENLVGQETQIEDSRGFCWTVKLENYKGKLAFQRGWYEFSVDHDLNIGDFLVFSHHKGGHFVVSAFGKDGCEKVNTDRTHPPSVQRARSAENTAAENTPYRTSFNYARNGKSARSSVEIQPQKVKRSNCNLPKRPKKRSRNLKNISNNVSENEKDSGSIRKISAQSNDVQLEAGNTSNVDIQPQSLKRKRRNLPKRPKKTSRNLKRKPSTRREGGNSFATPKTNVGLKIEPVDSTIQNSLSCLAAKEGSHYIELPHCVPSVKFSCKREGRAALVLEDPQGREWGSIYNQKFGLYVLVSQWDKINAENGIQPGDNLVFNETDASMNKYKFDIVREQLEH